MENLTESTEKKKKSVRKVWKKPALVVFLQRKVEEGTIIGACVGETSVCDSPQLVN